MNNPESIHNDGAAAQIYRRSPDLNGLKTLAIGGVRFDEVEAGLRLLSEIAGLARDEGYQALLGPLDGDTWHSYRLVCESDGSAPFLMEPVSGPHDLTVFRQSGFSPVSTYLSAKANLTETLGDKPAEFAGITVEAWDGENGENLIRHLYQMSTGSFASNHFYTPIDFDAFWQIYKPIMPFVDPQHILFANDENGDLKGFLFGTPDLGAQDGKPAAVLKTYASLQRGVGHLLADTYHRRALDMGFETVIHALMHETNTSSNRSQKHKASVFRRYALMGREL